MRHELRLRNDELFVRTRGRGPFFRNLFLARHLYTSLEKIEEKGGEKDRKFLKDLREKQESEKIMEQVTSLLIRHEDLLFKLGLSHINSIHHA